eukprot:7600580-Ditylum_brightwellii.AAC.2
MDCVALHLQQLPISSQIDKDREIRSCLCQHPVLCCCCTIIFSIFLLSLDPPLLPLRPLIQLPSCIFIYLYNFLLDNLVLGYLTWLFDQALLQHMQLCSLILLFSSPGSTKVISSSPIEVSSVVSSAFHPLLLGTRLFFG